MSSTHLKAISQRSTVFAADPRRMPRECGKRDASFAAGKKIARKKQKAETGGNETRQNRRSIGEEYHD